MTRGHLRDQPHHDGSPTYTDPGPYRLGDTITVRVRVPNACRAERVTLRSTPDAEPSNVTARRDRAEPGATWWAADLVLHNPLTAYRFLLEGDRAGYLWLNEGGTWRHDVTDSADFRIEVRTAPPEWLRTTVGYQVFLDRFATSGTERSAPDWAIPQEWGDPLMSTRDGVRQWFGGDLAGIEGRLDHLERLGVDLLYLTPFFPARSSHRYDATTFDHVDPLLGGDEALISLVAAAHGRGIRVIGDITLNHTGDHHDWFRTAQADPNSAEARFYMFGSGPHGYVAWHGVPSLPKLDHRSAELADRLYRGPGSVLGRYLRPPFDLDGWRVDCANTTARYTDIDLNHAVAHAARATVAEARDHAWLLAEHCYDAGADLDGAGWDGVMAYQWFTRPIWSWLIGPHRHSLMAQTNLPHLDGGDVVASMRHLGGNVPWAARQGSMTMLDSHDSSRFRSAVEGDAIRHGVGTAALMTMPGVPTLFAGSEVGVTGQGMDGCRVPFPWDESRWDAAHFERTRQLIACRRRCRALQHGGMRWLDAGDDTLTYVRELPGERVVVHLDRRGGGAVTIPTGALGALAGSRVTAMIGAAEIGADGLRITGDDGVALVHLDG